MVYQRILCVLHYNWLGINKILHFYLLIMNMQPTMINQYKSHKPSSYSITARKSFNFSVRDAVGEPVSGQWLMLPHCKWINTANSVFDFLSTLSRDTVIEFLFPLLHQDVEQINERLRQEAPKFIALTFSLILITVRVFS